MANQPLLTQFRPTDSDGRVPGVNIFPQTTYVPMAASTTIYAGGLIIINSSGYAVPAGSGVAGCCIGRCATGDGTGNTNVGQSSFTSTTAASIYITVEFGTFLWDNPDPLTFANYGIKVYASSDHSVSATANSNAAAGYFIGLDTATGTQAMVVTFLGAFGTQS
jgi:hypothetical protein